MSNGYNVRFGPQRVSPAVAGLIAANVAVFVLQMLLDILGYGRLFEILFGLLPPAVFHGYVWQLVTYMFLHGGVFHIFWNMLVLWMFGVDVESRMGTKTFLIFYFFCGIGAGLTSLAFPPSWTAVTVGASGALYGIFVASAVYFPDSILLVFFLFPMRMKHAVFLFGAIQLLAVMGNAGRHGGGVAYIAHLGGILFALLYFQAVPRLAQRSKHTGLRRKNTEIQRNDREEKEVDRILEKISREGIQSLSPRERNFLKNRSERRGH